MEEQPLLAGEPDDIIKHHQALHFNPNGDAKNPREWPLAYKYAVVLLLASMAFTVTFTCISVVPLAGGIVQDLDNGSSNPQASALLVTIWELGEAAGPLLIAPLSEVLGRYPVMNGCNIMFILTTILASISQSTKALIAMRALTGLAVASNVLNPAIIGDMFESDHRGSAMSLVMLAPLIGGAVGPAISGTISQTMGWRWVLYLAAGLATSCEILFLTCFHETYSISILRQRAQKLHLNSDEFPSAAKDEQGAHKNVKKLWHSITRPLAVLFGSGVLLSLSFFGSINFSYFYVMSITLANILKDIYGFSPALTGSLFVFFSVGSFIGVLICNVFLDKIYVKLRGDQKGKPEHRLPLAVIGAFALPLSLMMYGWTAHLHLPVPLLLASVSLLGLTLLLIMIPLSAYVVDAFGLFSASAMTGVIVTRCLMGTFLPLAASPLAQRFGYGWGFTFLAMASLALAPIPVFILRYGYAWRQRGKFTRDV
ncbi:MFS general substrate transporter [Lojkania enalia]|uniref:MFS general substrate transporter n=1 Tax=Lojkania enalia TaxID=147567 RepID=A0A9P4N1Q3_9PLEO|nr:MFS general substrate transporter [Didymosphaeria enalia]